MSFLPEDDRAYLESKGIKYELLIEKVSDGSERRGILFPGFEFAGALRIVEESKLVPRAACDLLILIPQGYATTQLDSFYTAPWLKRIDGTDPNCATSENKSFSRTWQFWSRHLAPTEWRNGIDGLSTFLSYVRRELATA